MITTSTDALQDKERLARQIWRQEILPGLAQHMTQLSRGDLERLAPGAFGDVDGSQRTEMIDAYREMTVRSLRLLVEMRIPAGE